MRARAHKSGIIDLSIGTPVDPVPEFIQAALTKAANSPGYPLTTGTPELRAAMRKWAENQLGVSGEFDLLPTIGSKELVAWLPTILSANTVLYPKIAYPTYLVGSIIHGSKSISVDFDAEQWPQAELAWINSPSNPTGRIHSESELASVISYSRKSGAVIASDECYFNFPAGDIKPISILKVANGENRNLLAVHSLSKRSNLAGYRAGMIIGDPELISRIREVRKHAGMMVPFPIQSAMSAALGDEEHVKEGANRYRNRRNILRPALEAAGFKIDYSDAGLYIWCTRNEEDWSSVSWLADLGILATPGHFYGTAGGEHIRIALTASDAQISDAANRIRAAI